MKLKINYFLIKIFLIGLSIFFLNCKKQYPAMNYLSPLVRDQEGFLDPDTYQVIGVAYSLPEYMLFEKQDYYLPEEMDTVFDIQLVESFNNPPPSRKMARNLSRFRDLLSLDLTSLPENSIDLKKIDSKFNDLTALKKHLMKNACKAANLNAVYRWFYLHSEKKNITKNVAPSAKTANYEEKKENYKEFPLISGFNSNLFPPAGYFRENTEDALNKLYNMGRLEEIEFELIQNIYSNTKLLECKSVYHVKKKDLHLFAAHLKH
ncbi:MAG: hypothetical protein OEZ13_11680 [Spirochaetia bacterium]|nr:hypothetical protein [Spirochaetia bacterium]